MDLIAGEKTFKVGSYTFNKGILWFRDNEDGTVTVTGINLPVFTFSWQNVTNDGEAFADKEALITFLDANLFSVGGGAPAEGVQDIIAGTNVSIDKTDPKNPVISATGEVTSGVATVTGEFVNNTDPLNPKLEGITAAIGAKADTVSLSAVATSGDYDDLSNKPDLSVFDDVDTVATFEDLPAIGRSDKFYVVSTTGLVYRWTGTAYTPLTGDLALGETSSTAYRGDRGKETYDLRHSHSNKAVLDSVTAAFTTELKSTYDNKLAASDIAASIVPVTGNKTLALTDAKINTLLYVSENGNITVPTNATVAFPLGSTVNGLVGNVTSSIIAASGVTLIYETADRKVTQNTGFSLQKVATNTWFILGKLTA